MEVHYYVCPCSFLTIESTFPMLQHVPFSFLVEMGPSFKAIFSICFMVFDMQAKTGLSTNIWLLPSWQGKDGSKMNAHSLKKQQ